MFTLNEADDGTRRWRVPGPWTTGSGRDPDGGQRLTIDILKEVVEAKKNQKFEFIHFELANYHGDKTVG